MGQRNYYGRWGEGKRGKRRVKKKEEVRGKLQEKKEEWDRGTIWEGEEKKEREGKDEGKGELGSAPLIHLIT